MRFKPVWVSSIKHLESFEESYQQTPLFRRVLGTYALPENFPYLQGIVGIPPRTPLVMFASGSLDISTDGLQFHSHPFRLPLNVIRNLSTDLEFQITADDIQSIETYEFASPALEYYNMQFVRVHTSHDNELSDILLYVGGTGPFMKKIRKQNEELLAAISETFPNAMKDPNLSLN